jgi:hypothetical protein
LRSEPSSSTGKELADRARAIIESRGLSLRAVSQKSAAVFGRGSPYFIPHNLHYELSLETFSPSLHQLFALSRISNHRFFDWLAVFGLEVEQISRLQIALPTKRTTLLDSSLGDPNAWVRWFRDKSSHLTIPPVAPLSQLLQPSAHVRMGSLLDPSQPKFLYAKIGAEDAFAFPDLLPGSIARIDPRRVDPLDRIASGRLFLIEHSRGISCCRLLAGAGRKITLVSTQLPYAQVQLKLHHEARILGVVDLEIRRLAGGDRASVPSDLAKRWKPEPLTKTIPKVSQWMSTARVRSGLSLREASQLSREVATLLDDDRYFISASSLSNHEADGTVPKHFQKAISLCLAYAISFRSFLRSLGIPEENAGTDPIPDRLIPRPEPNEETSLQKPEHEGVLGELMRQVGETPLFLRHAVNDISGLPSTSLRTVFWVGGIKNGLHRYLTNALLISVDRHKRLPVDTRSRPVWEQLSFVIIKRDGSYLIGPCGIENGSLIIHPDPEHLSLREEFRYHRDAEVIGQVSAVVRRM